MNVEKYHAFERIALANRQWPANRIKQAPRWCSIDLRDGNQSLIKPMNLQKKLTLFALLTKLGVKEIEVATPSANSQESDFVCQLINDKLIPSDVVIQVISQTKARAIEKTFQSLKGVKEAIVHLYNTTSLLCRDDLYLGCTETIMRKAVDGFKIALDCQAKMPDTVIHYEYSPEGFNTTEPAFALAVCNAVIDTVKPCVSRPLILNLQATVETDTPNVYADQIEWFISQLPENEYITVSIQPHNDRGTAIASTELGLLAGAKRVEGTLLGNGERAGSACLVTLGLNLLTQGIEPNLNLSDINEITTVVEECTGIATAPRHPYCGELVFTSFSAPHQYAIKEALAIYNKGNKKQWQVPYLPIDPEDIGRGFDDVIRLSALSGRTGIAYVMEKNHGYHLPKEMQTEFANIIKTKASQLQTEITKEQVWEQFKKVYFNGQFPLELLSIQFEKDDYYPDQLCCSGELQFETQIMSFSAEGSGASDTMVNALKALFDWQFDVFDYQQHALGQGSSAKAVSYIKIKDDLSGSYWGVGVDADATLATLRALICAVNRKLENEQQ